MTEITADTLRTELRQTHVDNIDSSNAEFTLFDADGRRLVKLTPGSTTSKALTGAIKRRLGQQAATGNATYALSMLARNHEALTAQLESDNCMTGEGAENLALLLKIVDEHRERVMAEYAQRLADGRIEFDDLGSYYAEGTEVFFGEGDTMIGGPVSKTGVRYTPFGQCFFAVAVDSIANVDGKITNTTQESHIFEFEGLVAVADLPIRPLAADSEQMAALVERGRRFAALVGSPAYMAYSGNIVRPSYFGETTFRADGRVMVDGATFSRVDSDQLDYCKRRIWGTRRLSTESYDDVGDNSEEGMVPEDKLHTTVPWVFGFSFRAKTWGTMLVSQISDIRYAEGAYERLVLDERTKKRVRALVEHSAGGFGDIIEGKGGGCIFLLHGFPGLGKTLTAETVAEHLKRPLYPISVGELGTDPDQLEDRLRQILDLASSWNAVLLLDEADIFMEARDERDVLRNAMVGVFLRLLEYHQGVMFLTTNRVRNIDTAFLSRISVGIFFGPADVQKRAKIWSNLLSAARIDLTAAQVTTLAEEFPINGRQMKNAIRGALTMAKDDGVPVGFDHLREEVEETVRFEADIRALSTSAQDDAPAPTAKPALAA